MRTKRIWMIAITATLLAAGASFDLALAEVPEEPAGFTDPLTIDNPYHPFVEYRIRLYEVQQGHTDLHVIDVFTDETREFELDGEFVECACLEEWEIEDGVVVEISLNYFAQADDGTVYYFGETVTIFDEDGSESYDGSWLVGGPTEPGDPEETATADEPAVFMPADPEIGDVWKPEDLPDDGIEEFVEAIKFRKKLQTPLGKYYDVLEVEEETPDIEFKWYAAGLGFAKGKEKGEILMISDVIDSADAGEMQDALDEILDELLEDDE